MMKSRRDLFEEQLRDLQKDISSLSNKLSTPSLPLNTSVNSQSIKNTVDINKSPSFEEKQNQQSTSENNKKDPFLNGPVSTEKLRQAIYDANKERDESMFKLEQMKVELDDLRKLKQESLRLKASFDHLKQENDSLRISLESSERIRKQQKDLITTLQRSHMTNADSTSVLSFNSQSTISNRTDNNSLLVDNSKWLNNSYVIDDKTPSLKHTFVSSSTFQSDGKKNITKKNRSVVSSSNPKRVLTKSSQKSDNSIYSNNSNSKKLTITKPNNNNKSSNIGNNKTSQSLKVRATKSNNNSKNITKESDLIRSNNNKNNNNNDDNYPHHDLNSSAISASSISRLKTNSFDSGISSTSIPSILKSNNYYNNNNNNNNDIDSVNSVDVAVAGSTTPYYNNNYNMTNKEVSFSKQLNQPSPLRYFQNNNNNNSHNNNNNNNIDTNDNNNYKRPSQSGSSSRSLNSPASRVSTSNKSSNNNIHNSNNNNNGTGDNNKKVNNSNTGRPPRYPYDSPFFQQHEFTGKPNFDNNNNNNNNKSRSISASTSRRTKAFSSNTSYNNNSGNKRSRSAPPTRTTNRSGKY